MTAGRFYAPISTLRRNGAPTSDSGRTVRIESFGDDSCRRSAQCPRLGAISDGDVDAETIAATVSTRRAAAISMPGSAGFTRFAVPGEIAPDVLHTLTARFVTSDGGINFDGTGANVSSPATNGGALTINANSLSFDVEGDILGSVTFNGGNGFSEFAAGSGGTFIANTTGDILVAELISATTGSLFGGAGGSVTLNSAGGMVTINDTILVSSNDTEEVHCPVSATAGEISPSIAASLPDLGSGSIKVQRFFPCFRRVRPAGGLDHVVNAGSGHHRERHHRSRPRHNHD